MVVADDEAGTVASDVLPFLRASCPDARTRPSAAASRHLGPSRKPPGKPERELSHFSTAAQMSYSIEFRKRSGSKRTPGAFQPPPPSARAVYLRTRPQRGLAGVFSISGSHLVRQAQFESGQNCSDGLFRLAQPPHEGLSGSYERRPTWISSSDPKTLSATVVF